MSTNYDEAVKNLGDVADIAAEMAKRYDEGLIPAVQATNINLGLISNLLAAQTHATLAIADALGSPRVQEPIPMPALRVIESALEYAQLLPPGGAMAPDARGKGIETRFLAAVQHYVEQLQ